MTSEKMNGSVTPKDKKLFAEGALPASNALSQTPVLGAAADHLRLGDRVWMRHAKGGELAERFTHYHVIDPADGYESARPVPTYRGEGQCFR